MFDILVSFALGTLLGVCLTLLTLGIKNKRKASPLSEDNESADAESLSLSKGEGQFGERSAVKPKTQESLPLPPVSNDFDELEGFVRLDGAVTEYPVFETKIPAEEIEEIQNVPPSKGHLENESIEAELVAVATSDSELREAARLEAIQHKTSVIKDDRVETERVEATRIAAEREEVARAVAERVEAERVAAERVEAERVEAERVEAERVAAERVEAEQAEAELLSKEFAALQAAQQVAELAAKVAANLEIEHASKRAADEAAVREVERQRQQQENDRVQAEQVLRNQLDQLAKVEAEGAAGAAEAINIGVVKKVGKTPEDTLIMIADDSKVVRVKTSRVLIKHLYQVTLAEDGNEAASQLDFIMPDLLITDVEMPGMDGFELTHHLRSNPATATLPIIMISGGSDALVEKAKLAGIDVLLGKPYSDEDLLGHIRRLTHGI